MTMERKNYPQVYLEECKYKVKKKKMPEFMNAELNSNSDFDSERLQFLLTRCFLNFINYS